MKRQFQRKTMPLMVAHVLTLTIAAGIAIPAQAQYYNVVDNATTQTLLDAFQQRTVPTTDTTLRDKAPVIVAAHRGMVDVAHPENTVEAVVNTMNYGIEAIELDVYESSDHIPYLMHDKTLLRMLNRREYSDIYRWEKEGGGDITVKTPPWDDIRSSFVCDNRADGYGMTEANPYCDDRAIRPASLNDALHALYLDGYTGLVFLDLRQPENVRDTAARLVHALNTDGEYGVWVAQHVVLKFQTSMFNGPDDYAKQVVDYHASLYGQNTTPTDVSQLFVQPVYTTNGAAAQGSGASPWATNDFTRWRNWFENQGLEAGLLSPELSLKAAGAILNYGKDDLFTTLWQDGLNLGVYVPERLCTVASPSGDASNLAGDAGTIWEGGVCGPLVPPMKPAECGSASTTRFDRAGGGCTDHRPFREWWHDTAKFGFVITDKPVETIQYLAQFPGQRPGIKGINGVNLGALPPLVVAADGSGSYTTIAAALAAVPAGGGIIQIRPGVYHEKLRITQANVGLLGTGSDASQVVITNNDAATTTDPDSGKPLGTSGSSTLTVSGSDFYAANLTIQNTADYEAPGLENNAQAVALLSRGDRAVYRAVRVLGGQDTLYVTNGQRAYFDNCYVEGYVDYIFGNGKAVFDNSIIKTKIHGDLGGEATITAQSRGSASEDNGFVFNNTQLLFDSPYMNNVWLGRPWGQYSTVYFLHTKLGSQVRNAGWIEFIPLSASAGGTNNLPTSTYREYDSSIQNAAGTWGSFDIGQRESASPKSNVPLSDGEAAALAADVYLAGSDGWQPSKVVYGSTVGQALPLPTLAVGAPNAPTIAATTAGNHNVQVRWGGQPANPVEQGYILTARQGSSTFGPITLPPTATTGYVDGLDNGAPATVSVVEFNAKGNSAASVSATVTPVANDPTAPASIHVDAARSSATVTFTIQDQGSAPVYGGSVAHAGVYTALYASQNDAYAGNAIAGTSTGFTTPSWTFNNLSPNTTYWVSLRAYNGNWSPTAVTSFKTAP
ncbi:pectinesterase family protein [Xanthomonas bundabergensis]|uniref:pectinesterase family protein n=1 Tax=Xanthomonas bundabergensis TaxID=3160842 RepID=UPI0035157AD3